MGAALLCSTVRWLALSQQEGPEFNTTMRPGSFSVAFACSPQVPQLPIRVGIG